MKKKSIIILVVCVLLCYLIPYGLIFSGIFIASSQEIDEFEKTKNGYVVEDKITITNLDSYYNEEKNIYVITGVATNKSDKDMSSGDITFQLFDKDGSIMGEAFTSVSNFSKGKSWKFKAEYESDDANEINSFELIRVYFYED